MSKDKFSIQTEHIPVTQKANSAETCISATINLYYKLEKLPSYSGNPQLFPPP